jgi:DNA-binding Lrp family transcriptional regulator
MTMDDRDAALLALLAQNARLSTAELARRLSLSRTTVQARIERLERSGPIRGYTIVRGPDGDTGTVRASVLISIEPRMTAAVTSALKTMAEIESLHVCAGRFDMIAAMAARGTEALDRAIDRIGLVDGVRATESLILLATKFDRRPPVAAG